MIARAWGILQQQGLKALVTKVMLTLKERKQYKRYLLALEQIKEKEGIKKDEVKLLQYRPKISIIVPVYNTNEKWLRLCIESVRKQVYDNWELCIVDGGSTKSYMRKALEGYAEQEPRMKLRILGENGGIARNSNEALALATGDFVGFLDHDDELESSALYEVVKLLNEKKDIDFIYSDEDKISMRGNRVDPHFKPDWSPDTLYSCNYIAHFSVIRKSVMDGLGGFREGYDGSQDYDLFMRVVERTQRLAHIRKVLYHWRMIARSAASSSNAKPYAHTAAGKAIKDSLGRRKVKGEVLAGPSPGFYRVKYKILGNPKVSIIIPIRDKVKYLQKCIQSILNRTEYDNYEILIVDNLSREPQTFRYYEEIRSNRKVCVAKYDEPLNYSAINNYAVSLIDSEYVVFLNQDTEVISTEWLTAMLEHVQREEVGVAGGLLYYPNNTIRHAGVVIGIRGVAGYSYRRFSRTNLGYFNRARIIQNVSAVTGDCMMTRKSIFQKVGGFDDNFTVAFGDIDFCLKVRAAGSLVVYTPYAELYHRGSLHGGSESTPENQARFGKEIEYFQKKWKDELAKGDPYYNPNLTIDREDFSIRI